MSFTFERTEMTSSQEYLTSPHLIRATHAGAAVWGITVLNDKVYIIRNTDDVEEYDANMFNLLTKIEIPLLIMPCDMACSTKYNCLYVADEGVRGRGDTFVHRVDFKKQKQPTVKKWPVNIKPHGISVTPDQCHVIVTCVDLHKLKEFTTNGVLIREIELHEELINPTHAIQLAGGQFVLCHGVATDQYHRICIVENDGHVSQYHGGLRRADMSGMNSPVRMAIDQNGNILLVDIRNKRILILSQSLNDPKELITAQTLLDRESVTSVKEDSGNRFPHRLCLNEKRGLLYVAECEREHGRWISGEVLVFKVKDIYCADEQSPPVPEQPTQDTKLKQQKGSSGKRISGAFGSIINKLRHSKLDDNNKKTEDTPVAVEVSATEPRDEREDDGEDGWSLSDEEHQPKHPARYANVPGDGVDGRDDSADYEEQDTMEGISEPSRDSNNAKTHKKKHSKKKRSSDPVEYDDNDMLEALDEPSRDSTGEKKSSKKHHHHHHSSRRAQPEEERNSDEEEEMDPLPDTSRDPETGKKHYKKKHSSRRHVVEHSEDWSGSDQPTEDILPIRATRSRPESDEIMVTEEVQPRNSGEVKKSKKHRSHRHQVDENEDDNGPEEISLNYNVPSGRHYESHTTEYTLEVTENQGDQRKAKKKHSSNRHRDSSDRQTDNQPNIGQAVFI